MLRKQTIQVGGNERIICYDTYTKTTASQILLDQATYKAPQFTNLLKTMKINTRHRSIYIYICDKARKPSFAAMYKCVGIGKITAKIGFQLFNTCVLPIPDYTADIWCKCVQIEEIDRNHLRFINML